MALSARLQLPARKLDHAAGAVELNPGGVEVILRGREELPKEEEEED